MRDNPCGRYKVCDLGDRYKGCNLGGRYEGCD